MTYEPLYDALFAKALEKQFVAAQIAAIPEFNPNCDITVTSKQMIHHPGYNSYSWVERADVWRPPTSTPGRIALRPAMIAARWGWQDLAKVLAAREDTDFNFVYTQENLPRGSDFIEPRPILDQALANGHETIAALYEARLKSIAPKGAAALKAQAGPLPGRSAEFAPL